MEAACKSTPFLATSALFGCQLRAIRIRTIQTVRGIGALGSDEISRDNESVKSLKVVLYGEPRLKVPSEGSFSCAKDNVSGGDA